NEANRGDVPEPSHQRRNDYDRAAARRPAHRARLGRRPAPPALGGTESVPRARDGVIRPARQSIDARKSRSTASIGSTRIKPMRGYSSSMMTYAALEIVAATPRM